MDASARSRTFLCLLLVCLTLSPTASQPKGDQYGGKQEEKRPWWKKIIDPIQKPLRTVQSVQLLLMGNKDQGRGFKNGNKDDIRRLPEMPITPTMKTTPTPVTKPTKPTPVTKPTKPTPVTKPTKPTPVTKPTKPTPVTKPTKPTPVTKPTKPTPVTKPTKPTPVTKPTKPTPVTKPTKPTPVTKPTTPTPVTKPTTKSTENPRTLLGNGDSLKARANLQRFMEEPCGVSLESRIINGDETMPGEFPWLALLQVRDVYFGGLKFICGGTLINDRYVLTAAHCVKDFRYEPVSVRLGEYNTETDDELKACSKLDPVLMTMKELEICRAEPPKDYAVEMQIVHPDYVPGRTLPNDIAMVRLKTVVEFTYYITPVCLPIGDYGLDTADIKIGVNATVAGWGMTEHLSNSPVPLKASLPIMEYSACKRLVKEMIPGKLCVGDNTGSSPCFGDSGGPLILRTMMAPFDGETNDVAEESIYDGYTRSVLLGVVSSGPGYCNVIQPTLTTNVLDYMIWILENIDP